MLVCVSTYFLKCSSIFEKVLLKLSSTFKLGRLKQDEDNRSSTCIDCSYICREVDLYSNSGVGLLFIYLVGKPRPECRINMIQSSHLFCRELGHLGD